jgi:hypothetical protein
VPHALLAAATAAAAKKQRTMADTEGEEKKPDTGALNLKVVTQDGNEIFFKCKMTTPLQKVCVDVRFSGVVGGGAHAARPFHDGGRLPVPFWACSDPPTCAQGCAVLRQHQPSRCCI